MSLPSPDLIQQLRQGDYAALQNHLGQLQNDFETDKAGEHELAAAFGAFDLVDATLGEQFTGWLNAYPNSYTALVALSTWLVCRGVDMRGGGTANQVSDHGRRGMTYFFQQGEGAARHAAEQTANPLSAWLVVGRIQCGLGCQMEPGDVEAQNYPDWYAEPLAQNPHSLALRQVMLKYLRTEWGGSDAQMLAFVRQQQDSGALSQADLQKLWGQYHAQTAHYAWLFSRNIDKALEHARLAADLDSRHAELLFALLTDQKHPAAERQEALSRFVDELERHPENGLWYARSALPEKTDVLAPYAQRLNTLLERMVRAGKTDAAFVLGVLSHKAPKLGFSDPTPLLSQTSQQGNMHAAVLVAALADKSLQYTADQKRSLRLAAADAGNGAYSWQVYQHFTDYRQQFGLDERARFRYLLQAADDGDNDARLELAQNLRSGRVEMGEDGVLRPVDTSPLQESLDYAKHLLERAAGEDDARARNILKKAKPADWNAKTARRLKHQLTPARDAKTASKRRLYLVVAVLVTVARACNHLSHSSTPAPQSQVQPPGISLPADL